MNSRRWRVHLLCCLLTSQEGNGIKVSKPAVSAWKRSDQMERVVVSIDGSNFYHLCRENFSASLDIGKVANWATNGRSLIRTYYYNCPLPQTADPVVKSGQQKFFSALQRVPYLEVRLGRLVQRDKKCPTCQTVHTAYEEKGVDMRIGIDLLVGAHSDRFDTAVLISGDADLTEAVQAVKNFGKHVEVVEFPRGSSRQIIAAADVVRTLDAATAAALLFK